jgi:CheY-like chemotaxis protein
MRHVLKHFVNGGMMPEQVITSNTTEQPPMRKLIFVVDDDVEIGSFILEVIRQETPYKGLHHTTGSQALHAITIHTPHLFILDYNLPDINGFELHDQLHTFAHLKAVPTILMSSYHPSLRELRKRHITYLAKPFELTDLLHAFEKYLA